MNESDQLKMFFALSVGHLPIMITSIVALCIVGEQRHRAPEAARWAFWGFGLILVLSLALPLGQVLIQAWIIRASLGIKQYQWIYSVFGISGSSLDAAALSFLLVAIFSGRPRPGIPPLFPPV